ncbi:MAG: hypothetical protein ACI8VI_001645, partial [Granulosicoccus sp.]
EAKSKGLNIKDRNIQLKQFLIKCTHERHYCVFHGRLNIIY